MSQNSELFTILKTLQTYAECDITHSFSEHDTEVLLVSYSKEAEAFIITEGDSEAAFPDIEAALTQLERLLRRLNATAR
jgi:uncharacterized protein YkuJ